MGNLRREPWQTGSMQGRLRAAAAGATAATVWALQEPVDQRIFRSGYSDVAVLGKAVTRGPYWRTAGLAIHAFNGAVLGLSHYELRRVVTIGPRKVALTMALVEHVALYPLCYLIDLLSPGTRSARSPAVADQSACVRAG